MSKVNTVMAMVKFNDLSEEAIEKAVDDRLDIVSVVAEEMMYDTENESVELLNFYKECSVLDRGVVDAILSYLCGWTMESLIEKAEPMIY